MHAHLPAILSQTRNAMHVPSTQNTGHAVSSTLEAKKDLAYSLASSEAGLIPWKAL